MLAEQRASEDELASRGRRRRRRRILHLSVYVVVLALLGLSLPLYVFPPQHLPAKADVVYVLGAPESWRVTYADSLIRDGHAGAMLISVPAEGDRPSTCSRAEPYPVVCAQPRPATTEGEAHLLEREMATHDWHTIIVVTSTPHIARARFIIDRCVPNGVSVVGRSTGLDLGDWVWEYVYQTVGFAKAIVRSTC